MRKILLTPANGPYAQQLKLPQNLYSEIFCPRFRKKTAAVMKNDALWLNDNCSARPFMVGFFSLQLSQPAVRFMEIIVPYKFTIYAFPTCSI